MGIWNQSADDNNGVEVNYTGIYTILPATMAHMTRRSRQRAMAQLIITRPKATGMIIHTMFITVLATKSIVVWRVTTILGRQEMMIRMK